MTQISILPMREKDAPHFEAVAGDKHAIGRTAGEALDLLTAQFPEQSAGFLVIVQDFQPDSFFSAQQQQRLQFLMQQWRTARDTGKHLPAVVQKELETLVETELNASAARAAFLAEQSGR